MTSPIPSPVSPSRFVLPAAQHRHSRHKIPDPRDTACHRLNLLTERQDMAEYARRRAVPAPPRSDGALEESIAEEFKPGTADAKR